MMQNLVTLNIKKMFLPEKEKTFEKNGIPFANWEQFLKDNIENVEMNLPTGEKKDTRLYLLEITIAHKSDFSLKMLTLILGKLLEEQSEKQGKKFYTPCLECLNLLIAKGRERSNFCYLLYDVRLSHDNEEFFYYFSSGSSKPSLRRILAEHPLRFSPGEKINVIACQ